MTAVRLSVGVVVFAAAGVLQGAAPGAFAAGPAKHVVTIDGSKYEPAAITVKKGETVTWVNKDPFPHTVTSAGKFDSKSIAPNGKWSWRAKASGEHTYICTLHPNMKGTLKVE